MNFLSVENLSKTYGTKTLFSNISFGIDQGQRVALVARNGTGKSTLLKILQGKDIPDSGEVAFRNDARVAFLEQEPEFKRGDTVYQALFNSENEMLKVVRAYELAQENYNKDQSERHQNALSNAMLAMDEKNAWDYEGNIKQILTRLKIGYLEQEVSTLSGGQKKRLALARILIEEPQLMIMDEPTNHLDIEMIEWLENYFERNDITLFLVTHDRYFLDNVCTDILEIENGEIYRYKGNYEYFIEKKAEREFNEGRELDKAKQLFKKELEWVRRQPKARGTKSKSRIEAFENLKKKVSVNTKVEEINLDFKMNRIGGKILEMKKVSKRFDDLVVLDHFDYTFKKGERIGIVGKNGTGKTTFLNILSGKEGIDSGKVNIGETLVFGYYSQDGINLKDDQRVVELVRDAGDSIPMADGSKLNAVQLLNLFQFSPDLQHGFVSKLSGGEKKRLYLLTILMKNPNFLILDEPTNDLDLMTLSVLEDYLLNFAGCLLIVSHDRYFMDKLVDQLFVFEGKGVVQPFNGTYTEYRVQKAEKEKAALNKPTVIEEVPAAVEKPAEPKKKVSYKEKLEWETLDKEIPKLEEKKAALETRLLNVGSDHQALLEVTAELQRVSDEIDEKSLRWLELSEMM